MLRPYQWIGILTLGATMIRFFGGRLSFTLPKIHRLDGLLFVLWLGSLAAVLGAPHRNISLKQSLVMLSFIALYVLVRIFVRTVSDIKNIVAVFIGSGVVISAYAIWQNMRFAQGLNAFEVMAGRSNSVFTEPDWLGAFAVVCIGALYALLWFYRNPQGFEYNLFAALDWKIPFALTLRRTILALFYGSLILSYIALILSVSRSAWLSVAIMTCIAWSIVASDGASFTFQKWKWRDGLTYASGIAFAFIVSLAMVFVFHLTSFQLFNRAQSTISGLQNITVACKTAVELPETIASIDELSQYDCRHIDLEDRELLAQSGEWIRTVYRSDPNVSIRKEIYAKTLRVLREHFFLGVGFGSSAFFLGNDERGAGLNTSNIFLEVWLGSGLVGLVAFVWVWVSIGVVAIKRLLVRQRSDDITAIYLFIFLSWIGLTIFNLFNAGIFLGFFFVWLAIAVSFSQKK
jgi:hypothetical protein